jgi:hypothetical protein
MARAAPESTGDEIWFNDAVTLLAERCGSSSMPTFVLNRSVFFLDGRALRPPTVAERVLVWGIKAHRVPWFHTLEDGTCVAGNDAFFDDLWVVIVRAENRAFISAPMPSVAPDSSSVPTEVLDIKVSRAAVLALVSAAPVSNASAKTLIEDEAKRMKRDGEIPEGILKTDFAKALASKAGVTPKYVRNNLKAWGLWPVSGIK